MLTPHFSTICWSVFSLFNKNRRRLYARGVRLCVGRNGATASGVVIQRQAPAISFDDPAVRERCVCVCVLLWRYLSHRHCVSAGHGVDTSRASPARLRGVYCGAHKCVKCAVLVRSTPFFFCCVAQRLLDQGVKWCTLLTDQANPVSNSMYRKIGYQATREFAMFECRQEESDATKKQSF